MSVRLVEHDGPVLSGRAVGLLFARGSEKRGARDHGLVIGPGRVPGARGRKGFEPVDSRRRTLG